VNTRESRCSGNRVPQCGPYRVPVPAGRRTHQRVLPRGLPPATRTHWVNPRCLVLVVTDGNHEVCNAIALAESVLLPAGDGCVGGNSDFDDGVRTHQYPLFRCYEQTVDSGTLRVHRRVLPR